MPRSAWLIVLTLFIAVSGVLSAAVSPTNATMPVSNRQDNFSISVAPTITAQVDSYLESLFAELVTTGKTGYTGASKQQNMTFSHLTGVSQPSATGMIGRRAPLVPKKEMITSAVVVGG